MRKIVGKAMRKIVVLLTSVALAMVLAAGVALVESVRPADAAFPGKNGKIAFARHGNILTTNPNGSAKTKLTNTPNRVESSPNFSANGRWIVYVSTEESCSFPCSEIHTMRADGSHKVRLTKNKRAEFDPAWSPNGQKIVFARHPGVPGSIRPDTDLFTINRDGSGLKRLTNTPRAYELSPAWSPDGSTIAFVRERDNILLMKADGSDEETLVTADPSSGEFLADPDWSPDGQWLAFKRADEFGDWSVVSIVRKDGTGLMNLRQDAEAPAFSPNGKKMVFNSSYGGNDVCRPPNVYTMKLDGSESTLLVRYSSSDCFQRRPEPSWQPLP